MFCESEKILESLVKYIGKPNKTNCYLSYIQLQEMLQNNNVQVEVGKKCIYILIEKEDYMELFFFVNELLDLLVEREFLRNILPINKKTIISIISKIDKDAEYQQLLSAIGFSLYKKYLRKYLLKNNITLNTIENEKVCFAEPDDIKKIQILIAKTFDEISDQIPNRKELEQLISRNRILKYITADGLAGFLISERQGKKSYLRMLCIDEQSRGNGIGKILLQEYIKLEYEYVDVFYLWVAGSNQNAIELYAKYGYISDGLEQYIFVTRENYGLGVKIIKIQYLSSNCTK